MEDGWCDKWRLVGVIGVFEDGSVGEKGLANRVIGVNGERGD